MTDPKLSKQGAVGLKAYRVSYKNGVIEEDGSPRSCGDSMPMHLASDVAAALSAKDAELQSAIQRWDDEHELHKQNVYGLQAKLSAAEAELARVRERVTQLEPAAECWDALCKCYRITCMGSAGLHDTKHANGYAHATFNLWTIAPGHEPTDAKDAQSLHGADMLSRFMTIAIKNHPLSTDGGAQR